MDVRSGLTAVQTQEMNICRWSASYNDAQTTTYQKRGSEVDYPLTVLDSCSILQQSTCVVKRSTWQELDGPNLH